MKMEDEENESKDGDDPMKDGGKGRGGEAAAAVLGVDDDRSYLIFPKPTLAAALLALH